MIVISVTLSEFDAGESGQLVFGGAARKRAMVPLTASVTSDLDSATAMGYRQYAVESDDASSFRVESFEVKEPDDGFARPTVDWRCVDYGAMGMR